MACMHDGFYSATSHYDRECEELHFVLVCEACGQEMREVERVAYAPAYEAQTRWQIEHGQEQPCARP